jgi:hypothetical protein
MGWLSFSPGGRRRGRPALCSPLERNTRGTFSTELARESVLRLCAGRRLWEHAVARQRGVQRRTQQLHLTRLHWKGHAFDEDDGSRIERQIDFAVSDLTKVIDGVQTRVAWERDYRDGEMEEVELTYYAQDDSETVWYFGEYSEELDNGKIDDSPAWLGGQQKARPGITMQAQPTTGTKDYGEGWGPAVEWNDRAKVDQVGISNCVPTGCYHDVVVIAKFDNDEPGKTQLKYYAPGVGGTRTGWRGKNDKEREDLG